ncbi:MAG TPA: copper-binding protein, partial [Caulobacteraceae bacterium]
PGHRGGGGGAPGGSAKPGPGKPPPAPDKPVNQIEIVGVIKAIDPASGRITIAYELVDELNWPAGTMPFVVGKTALLTGAAIGEKIRFKLDNQQISELRPF